LRGLYHQKGACGLRKRPKIYKMMEKWYENGRKTKKMAKNGIKWPKNGQKTTKMTKNGI
jgi:hypothetical protein